MSPTLTIILIIVILVVIAVAVVAVRSSRRKKLQNTFGPEYDRVVADSGNRADAEKELRERERRHAELELKPLNPESQRKYAANVVPGRMAMYPAYSFSADYYWRPKQNGKSAAK